MFPADGQLRRPLPRYPWDDLGRLVAVQTCDGEIVGTYRKRVARHLLIDQRQLARVQESGLTRDMAIRLSEAAGFLPYEVWPEILYDVDDGSKLAAGEVVCESWGCENVFLPTPRGGSRRWPQRFCSDRCRRRDKQRRHRGFTPPTEIVCAARDCETTFVPPLNNLNQRFCSRTCRDREKQRRYRTRPGVLERRREAQRRYRQETGRSATIKRRIWRAANRDAVNAYQRAWYAEHKKAA